MKATVINFFESIDQQNADEHRYEYNSVLTVEEAKAEMEWGASQFGWEFAEVWNYDEDGDIESAYTVWNDGTVEELEYM